MRTMRGIAYWGCLTLIFLGCSCRNSDDPKQAASSRVWAGNHDGGNVLRAPHPRSANYIPLGGRVIRDANTFEALWGQWYAETAPKVEFDKHIVIVACSGGCARTRVELNKRGSDLEVNVECCEVSFSGFSWCMREVESEGILTLNGKPLADAILDGVPSAQSGLVRERPSP